MILIVLSAAPLLGDVFFGAIITFRQFVGELGPGGSLPCAGAAERSKRQKQDLGNNE